MKKYETLIFDLDNTLIDNNQAMKYALTTLVTRLGLEHKEKEFEEWMAFDTDYWHRWERGQVILPKSVQTLEEKKVYLRTNLFIQFFKTQGVEIDFPTALFACKFYYDMLGVDIVEIENASELLRELSPNYEILIATNGNTQTADKKLEKANLLPYVEDVISSDQIGFSKPMPQFFEALFERAKNKKKETMLLIGDSLSTDILGGNQNGIDTCWFNPNYEQAKEEIQPTMTIHKLLQLKRHLEQK